MLTLSRYNCLQAGDRRVQQYAECHIMIFESISKEIEISKYFIQLFHFLHSNWPCASKQSKYTHACCTVNTQPPPSNNPTQVLALYQQALLPTYIVPNKQKSIVITISAQWLNLLSVSIHQRYSNKSL